MGQIHHPGQEMIGRAIWDNFPTSSKCQKTRMYGFLINKHRQIYTYVLEYSKQRIWQPTYKMKQVQLRVASNISCVIVLLTGCHWGWWPWELRLWFGNWLLLKIEEELHVWEGSPTAGSTWENLCTVVLLHMAFLWAFSDAGLLKSVKHILRKLAILFSRKCLTMVNLNIKKQVARFFYIIFAWVFT